MSTGDGYGNRWEKSELCVPNLYSKVKTCLKLLFYELVCRQVGDKKSRT